MIFHHGSDFQQGRGIGSLFSGLFRTLVPIARAGANLGKRVLKSDFVQNLSKQALQHGAEMAKNVAADLLQGKNFSESASEQLEEAKKKVGEAIRGSGRGRGRAKRKRETKTKKTTVTHNKKCKRFNLFE